MRTLFLILIMALVCACSNDDDENSTPPGSDAKQITSFIFKAEDNKGFTQDLDASVNQENKTITTTIPFSADIMKLTPAIRISEKATIKPQSNVVQNFTNPVTYTITAENGSTQKYTANIVAAAGPETGKQLINFTFTAAENEALSEDVIAAIDEDNKKVLAAVPFGTNITALIPAIELSTLARVTPENKTAQDFTDPVIYTVTAEDGGTQEYEVTVDFKPNTEKRIINFVFLETDNNPVLSEDVTAEIDEDNKKITAKLPFGTGLTNLVPTIAISENASIDPANDGQGQDFTSPVTYTVTAEDGTTQEYEVTVTAPNTEAKIISFSFLMSDNNSDDFTALLKDEVATIDEENKLITVKLPYIADLSNLKPNITISQEAAIAPENNVVVDFTDNVIYTVTAEDGSTQEYTISITKNASPSQREVLILILNTNPNNTLAWDPFVEDLNQWQGIIASNPTPPEVSMIQTLIISSKQISYLPREIAHLINLNTFIAEKNRLTELPDEIGALSALREFWVTDNKLSTIPNTIGNLNNLEELLLEYNELNLIPKEIGGINNLKSLNLSNNLLTTVPAELANLSNLEYLSLLDNRLTLDSIPLDVCGLDDADTEVITGIPGCGSS